MLKEFFEIKIVLLALVFTVAFGIIGYIAGGIFLYFGWVNVMQEVPSTSSVYRICPLIGSEAPPFGFPFAYYQWTNMSGSSGISIPLWTIEACGVPSFVNPLAFLWDFILILTVIHLYRRLKAKKR